MLRAFISYPYKVEIEEFANSIRNFLSQLQIESIDGKWLDATVPLPKEIVNRIKDCEVLITLTFENCPSSWVDQEIGLAIGLGLDVIQITDGNVPRCGLLSEQFYLSRSKGEFFICTSLAHTLNRIKQKRASDLGQALCSNAPIDELESEAWTADVVNLIHRLRNMFAESQFEQILIDATNAFDKHPHCWRFLVSQSAALTHLNKLDEADEKLNDVIERFDAKPRALSYAYDNKGWVVSRRQSGNDKTNLKTRLDYHKLALQYEERLLAYLNVISCLLQLNRVNAAERELANCLVRFPNALESFRRQVKLQGKDFVQAIAKSHLISALIFPREEVQDK